MNPVIVVSRHVDRIYEEDGKRFYFSLYLRREKIVQLNKKMCSSLFLHFPVGTTKFRMFSNEAIDLIKRSRFRPPEGNVLVEEVSA